MRIFYRLFEHWRSLLPVGAMLAALALLWSVRDMPLQPAPALRIDALSAFFIFALAGGAALTLAARPGLLNASPWRALVLAALLIGGWVTTLIPAIIGAYLLLALWQGSGHDISCPYRGQGSGAIQRSDALREQYSRSTSPLSAVSRQAIRAWRFGGKKILTEVGRWVLGSGASGLLAAACLLVGYGALALHGSLRYDERTSGAALDGFVFWFVLLAAVVASSNLAGLPPSDWRPTATDQPATTPSARRSGLVERDIVRLAWLYPLARLYSLGPWNNGWSFATVLLGGGAALWAATSAFGQPDEHARHTRIHLSYLGLALAGLGLATSAGIAAGCYAMLAYLVLAAGRQERQEDKQANSHTVTVSPCHRVTLSRWLLSGAVPLTAPFVAAWMLVGAGQAGGVALLSGAAWLVVLLNALTTALMIGPEPATARRPLLVAAAASALLGVGAPLVVRALIQPVVEQLQGGLTPYGDVGIWPWIGLETIDSAHRQVSTLPAIAIAGLMLVLSALVYLVVRLREPPADAARQPGDDRSGDASMDDDPLRRLSELIAGLRDEVPWLGGAKSPPAAEEQRVDGK